jgi:hypothetical protein
MDMGTSLQDSKGAPVAACGHEIEVKVVAAAGAVTRDPPATATAPPAAAEDMARRAIPRHTIPPMITPSPTSRIDPALARGTLIESVEATATKPAFIKLAFPNTSYEMHLLPTALITTEPGKRLIGTIRARCRRIDVVGTGGRYVEPVYGRPRRVQGTVIAIDAAQGAVVVDATIPIHCTPTDPRQKTGDFQPGQLVSFDVLDGATFTPA